MNAGAKSEKGSRQGQEIIAIQHTTWAVVA